MALDMLNLYGKTSICHVPVSISNLRQRIEFNVIILICFFSQIRFASNIMMTERCGSFLSAQYLTGGCRTL